MCALVPPSRCLEVLQPKLSRLGSTLAAFTRHPSLSAPGSLAVGDSLLEFAQCSLANDLPADHSLHVLTRMGGGRDFGERTLSTGTPLCLPGTLWLHVLPSIRSSPRFIPNQRGQLPLEGPHMGIWTALKRLGPPQAVIVLHPSSCQPHGGAWDRYLWDKQRPCVACKRECVWSW